MTILNVSNLSKKYPVFILNNISFSLEVGRIMGLIGKNGAGKSTTIKAMLNMVCRDNGEITMFGKDFFSNEESCKQSLGVCLVVSIFTNIKKSKKLLLLQKNFIIIGTR